MDTLNRRKYERKSVNIKLKIHNLYNQEEMPSFDLDEPIEVQDISKSGLKFNCEHDLPLGYYFNANIIINDKEHFFSVVKIIRKEPHEAGFAFGCEFVGLADVLSNCIDEL